MVAIFQSHVKKIRRTTRSNGNFRELKWFGYMSTHSPPKFNDLSYMKESGQYVTQHKRQASRRIVMGLGYDPTALTACLNDLCILVNSPSLVDVQAHMYPLSCP
jgi:hypothetical protein